MDTSARDGQYRDLKEYYYLIANEADRRADYLPESEVPISVAASDLFFYTYLEKSGFTFKYYTARPPQERSFLERIFTGPSKDYTSVRSYNAEDLSQVLLEDREYIPEKAADDSFLKRLMKKLTPAFMILEDVSLSDNQPRKGDFIGRIEIKSHGGYATTKIHRGLHSFSIFGKWNEEKLANMRDKHAEMIVLDFKRKNQDLVSFTESSTTDFMQAIMKYANEYGVNF